jgi:ubiquinol-cytochrome c reductase cytochrome b subunit
VWLKGDYVVSDATLNRFFALHVIALPLVLIGLVFVHIIALHEVGSNNPDGVDIKKYKGADGIPVDGIPFHPYYTVKDLIGVAVFLIVFFAIVFFAPEMGGYFLEHANYVPADPLKTPEHIAPVWYFTPFYAILRAMPDKLAGVIAMFSAIAVLFFLPWIDRNPVRSIRYRSAAYKAILFAFVISFLVLGYYGMQPVTPVGTWISRLGTLIYFGFFVALFFISKNESTKPVPERVRY